MLANCGSLPTMLALSCPALRHAASDSSPKPFVPGKWYWETCSAAQLNGIELLQMLLR
jgi:hypothetical protein